MPSLRTISLYSGAGGLDHGFIRAGFDVVWANEIDQWACETYRHNVGDRMVCDDILAAAPPAGLQGEIVIGGPPCQGFSVIGKMQRGDPRSEHVFHFLDVVEDVAPDAFVMENVKALGANSRWGWVRNSLIDRAERLGFETKLYLLNAADYGVPQSRERMFLIGIRGATPSKPRPTTANKAPTVRDALSRLPRYGKPGNDTVINARVRPAARPVMRQTAFSGSLLFNGSGRPLHLDSPAKTLPASMGGNATPIIDQDELDRGAEPWVVRYHRRLLEGGKPLKRAPRRLRRITVEEAAALQSFPSDWIFKGPRVAQLRQIGNAASPELAFQIAIALRATLSAKSSDVQAAAA